MRRVDLHIVRATHGWQLQNADGKTLAAFRSVEAALENAEARAHSLQLKSLNARVTIHHPGKAPKVFDFAGRTAPMESYALTRCCLS